MNISEQILAYFLDCKSVSTDTRSIKNGDIFFALRGENFNGNFYAQKALDAGASKVVIDELAETLPDDSFFLVEDVLASLQKLATDYRKQLTGTVIGLTGSNGKTTCKELFRDVLATAYSTKATSGNLNNHIGVPLTILSIPKETEMAIIEMGANHQKEIELLSSIAQPDIGYITNYGKAHLEGFGGIIGVIKGKSELYEYLRANNKKALVNADDPKQMEKSLGIDRILFGNNGDILIEDLYTDYASAKVSGTIVQSNLTGSFHFTNMAAAIALGLHFKVDLEKIKSAIESYFPQMNRSEWRKTEKNEVLMDAYNANPDSMNAAIKTFANLDKPNKWFILGDMFELGKFASEEHQKTVTILDECQVENAILIGKAFNNTNHDYSSFNSTEEAREFIKDQKIENRTILLKGSRGMKLESLIDLF